MSITAARPTQSSASHFYYPDGTPAYEVENKSKGGMRPTTVRDARKLGLLPSVTTVLRVLHRPGLVNWMIEQAVLAALTTPRQAGEELDAFVYRVLHTERVQDEESQKARDRGTEIHAGLEDLFNGTFEDLELLPWIKPAYDAILNPLHTYYCEQVRTGDGYAGKVDLVEKFLDAVTIWDFKTTKELPDKPYPEHALQLAAYAATFKGCKVATANCYISTTEPGKFIIHRHPDWTEAYQNGFRPLLEHWQWANNCKPKL